MTVNPNASPASEHQEPLEIIHERYALLRVLGEGALGRTYLAKDLERRDSRVAVKELLPSRMKRWKDYDLFHRECQTLRSLSHPGIPAYVDDFNIPSIQPNLPDRLFLVQEFVEGQTLEELLKRGRSFSEDDVREILEQSLEILHYLHSLMPPVIHRDLKPSNMMMTSKGKIMIIDFGAVQEAVTAEGLGSTIVGTLGYMPPEQYAGKATPATDIFALGATCVELLSGRAPSELFEGLHTFHLPDDLPVTLGFERILLRMTGPEETWRYPKSKDVLRDLSHRFLMVHKASIEQKLPIPYEIRPAPRRFPNFFLRDPYLGTSHLGLIMLCAASAAAAFIFLLYASTITLLMPQSQGPFLPYWILVGGVLMLMIGSFGWAMSRSSVEAIQTYRRGQYTLGEVTGRFLSVSSSAGVLLTYRYRVDDTFRLGYLCTRDRAYRSLTPGDPLGVIYRPEMPDTHVLYAVPKSWRSRDALALRRFKKE